LATLVTTGTIYAQSTVTAVINVANIETHHTSAELKKILMKPNKNDAVVHVDA
jgi:hypothetical protein